MKNQKLMEVVNAACLTAAMMFILPLQALAQDQFGFKQGDREFSIQGSGSSDNEFDNTIMSASITVGKFFRDNIEGSIRQDLSFIDVPGDSDWNAATQVVGDIYFPLNRLQPMVGVGLGYVYGDRIKDQFFAGPEVGLKVFINETAFVSALVEYQFLFENADEADDAFDDGRFIYNLGVGVVF